jgi:hypothetical protein
MRFGLVNGFTEHLQIELQVTTALSLITHSAIHYSKNSLFALCSTATVLRWIPTMSFASMLMFLLADSQLTPISFSSVIRT